jgi:hypothetical protein
MNDKFKFGVLTSANIKTYCKGTVFKTVWHCERNNQKSNNRTK